MCAEALARILMFTANFAFLLVGLGLLTVGIFYTINYTQFTEAIPSDYQSLQYIPTVAIVIGAIIFIIAFLGCCGTVKNSICMLSTYAGILFLIFLCQVALGVYALVQIKDDDQLRSKIDLQVANLFSRYQDPGVTEIVDLIQQKLSCCGASTPLSNVLSNRGIPSSCYSDPSDIRTLFTTGCSSAVYNYFVSSVRTIAIVALSISAIEVIGAVLALCLSNTIRADRRRHNY